MSVLPGKRSDFLTCEFMHKIKFRHFVCIVCQALRVFSPPHDPLRQQPKTLQAPGYQAENNQEKIQFVLVFTVNDFQPIIVHILSCLLY